MVETAFITVGEVEEWIKEVLAQECAAVELRTHSSERIRLWKRKELGKPDHVAGELVKASERRGKISNAAMAQLTAVAFMGENDPPGTYVNSFPIVVCGGGSKRLEDVEQAPTLTGLTSQVLAQNSVYARLLVQTDEERTRMLLEENKNLRAELVAERQYARDAARRELEFVESWKKLETELLEREVARKKMQIEEERDRWLAEKLDLYLPVVANRFLGGGPHKGHRMVDEQMRQLLRSLRPEQIDEIMEGNLLTVEQRVALAELYKSYAEREETKRVAKNKHRGANGKADEAQPEGEGESS